MTRKQVGKLLERYRIDSGKGFRLRDHDPADTGGKLVDHEEATKLLASGVERLAALQEKLYADGRWALLCVLQAMDAAGKDGTIKHVMSGVNPQGVQVTAFKAPGPEDLAHDFLWRIHRCLPPRGMIGLFNRSQYEDVLVVRVNPALLAGAHLPEHVQTRRIWDHRLQDIANFEHYLGRQGIVVRKFFLHVSKDEQKRRFMERLDDPTKNWKFSAGDLPVRNRWDEYMAAYEEAIASTATPQAPWYVVPADHKWFSRLIVVEVMISALEELDLQFPTLSDTERERLAVARQALEAET